MTERSTRFAGGVEPALVVDEEQIAQRPVDDVEPHVRAPLACVGVVLLAAPVAAVESVVRVAGFV